MSASHDSRIELRLEGSMVLPGTIDLDSLAPLAAGLRKTLRSVHRIRHGQAATAPGAPTGDTKAASGLRLVHLKPGSTVLVFESSQVDLLGGRADETVRMLIQSLSREESLDPAVVDSLEECRRSLGDNASIEFITPWHDPVLLDEAKILRLRAQEAPSQAAEPLMISGWLHAADLDPDEVRIRDASGIEWTCSYDSGDEARIKTMLGSVVRAHGTGISTGKKGRIELDHIEALQSPVPLPDYSHLSGPEVAARLMREQNIMGPQPLESLRMTDLTTEERLAFQAAIEEIS